MQPHSLFTVLLSGFSFTPPAKAAWPPDGQRLPGLSLRKNFRYVSKSSGYGQSYVVLRLSTQGLQVALASFLGYRQKLPFAVLPQHWLLGTIHAKYVSNHSMAGSAIPVLNQASQRQKKLVATFS